MPTALRRRGGGAALLAIAALTVAGCSPSAQEAPEAVLTDFLDALRAGDYAAAVSLSTTDPDEFSCEMMLSDDGDISIAAPEVRSLEVDGDSASVAVDYRSPSPATLHLDMARVDGQWRVELPDDFRIEVAFDGPAVAEIVVDHECRVPVEDGRAELLAWPGLYVLDIEDPTGVVSWNSTLYSVPDQQTIDGDPLTMPAVPSRALLDIADSARPLLEDAMASCRPFGGPARADCPGVFSGVTLNEDSRLPALYLDIETVWTDDGAQWRFQTPVATLDVSRDGVPEQIEFRFKGTLDTDSRGELTLDLDASI